MTEARSWREIEEEQRRKTAVVGYDYGGESRLTPEELAECDPKRLRQFQLGIITAGEFDCLYKWGYMPWILYNVLESTI